jgi:hypothetical protein
VKPQKSRPSKTSSAKVLLNGCFEEKLKVDNFHFFQSSIFKSQFKWKNFLMEELFNGTKYGNTWK